MTGCVGAWADGDPPQALRNALQAALRCKDYCFATILVANVQIFELKVASPTNACIMLSQGHLI
jgi:hypothetical protein